MAWFRKDKKPLTAEDRRDVPTDVFEKCKGCGEILYRERLAQNLNVCPTCGHHVRIPADAYLSILLDSGTFEELDTGLRAPVPLQFKDLKSYPERIAAAEAKGKTEAVITGKGQVDGIDVVIAVGRVFEGQDGVDEGRRERWLDGERARERGARPVDAPEMGQC